MKETTTKRSKSPAKKKPTHTSSMPGAMSENGTDLGMIKIHENVISSIVRKATCSVEGVVRLAGSTLVDNIAEFVGSRKIHDRAISVALDGASVDVEVQVNVIYGIHVPTVAAEVQRTIIEQVEKITGMNVGSVNVVVQELETEDAEEEEEEES